MLDGSCGGRGQVGTISVREVSVSPDRSEADPLDEGEPKAKAWEEFRASYSTALILHWLFGDLDEIYPDYALHLWNRFQTAFDYRELFEKDGEFHGYVPLPASDDLDNEEYNVWYDYDDLVQWYDYLFPHRGTKVDTANLGQGLVVVALHSALESYARALDIVTGPPLPAAIRGFLEKQAQPSMLDADTFLTLVDCDATRHIIVHNRGVVDEKYLRAVHDSHFESGERRLLTVRDVNRFASAVRRTAELLRRCDIDQ